MDREDMECIEFGKAKLIGTAPKDSWRTEEPEVDHEKCTKCKVCMDVCPEGCARMEDEEIRVDYKFCKGCGICRTECPVGAIKMVEE